MAETRNNGDMTTSADALIYELLPASPTIRDEGDLVLLLDECVTAGASIGFLAPLGREEAVAYWRKVIADIAGGYRVIFVARDAEGIVGSAQLAVESRPNGRHRAEVQKVLVRPGVRRRGIATRLMRELEAVARGRGLSLLFLDTSEGPGGARALYDGLGYEYVGGIPGYALDPDGTAAANAIYYKRLA
jgi:acetyltransferase